MLKGANAGHTPEMQEAVANEVNSRMEKAAGELKAKYDRGQGGSDVSETGPTGAAYKAKAEAEAAARRAKRAQNQGAEERENQREVNEKDESDDEQSDEDNDLRMLRDKRLKEIREREKERLENIGKGHGQYREIGQDEFLPEVTGSDRVIVHFYHSDFETCKIMDMHLEKLSKRHVETKFVKVNAAKAPFFVEKLTVRTMPTLCQFVDGVCRGKQVGFEGMADGMPEGKEDEFPTIALARILAGNKMIDASNVVDEDGAEEAKKAALQHMRSAYIMNAKSSIFDLDEDEDFDDL